MPPASSGAKEGLVTAVAVLALTAFFTWRQLVDQKTREEDLSAEDADYYARRDRRRLVGTANLGLIGLGILAGSLIEPRRYPVAFISVWLTVGVLVCVSLIVAALDLMANNRYAKRHRLLLIEERRAILQEELRRHIAGQNGHGNPLA